MRDHNQEYQDNAGRKYSYDFDTIVRRYLLRTFAPHFNVAGATLEMGCYRGDMTEQILGYFPAISVMEASTELAGLVKARFDGRVEVMVSTFEDAAPASKFDNIFLIHTLEHLDEPVAILSKIRSWLNPNGKLFVAVPNANALSRQIAVKMGVVEFNSAVTPAEAEHGHRCTYSMDILHSQLRRSGYQLVDHGGTVLKALANFQFDQALAQGIIGEAYLDACHELGKTYPEFCASLFAVCSANRK